MIKNLFLVAIGGAFGSIARYLLSYFFTKNNVANFPWATFIANVFGCLVIGLFWGYIQKNNLQNDTLKLLVITGFCGGFTTFSTFSLENIQFIQNQNYNLAILYTFSSIIVGFLAVSIGFKLIQT
jgi:CrcB protein